MKMSMAAAVAKVSMVSAASWMLYHSNAVGVAVGLALFCVRSGRPFVLFWVYSRVVQTLLVYVVGSMSCIISLLSLMSVWSFMVLLSSFSMSVRLLNSISVMCVP